MARELFSVLQERCKSMEVKCSCPKGTENIRKPSTVDGSRIFCRWRTNTRSPSSETRPSAPVRRRKKYYTHRSYPMFKTLCMVLETAIWKAKSIEETESRSKLWRRSTKKTITIKRALQWRRKVAKEESLWHAALFSDWSKLHFSAFWLVNTNDLSNTIPSHRTMIFIIGMRSLADIGNRITIREKKLFAPSLISVRKKRKEKQTGCDSKMKRGISWGLTFPTIVRK